MVNECSKYTMIFFLSAIREFVTMDHRCTRSLDSSNGNFVTDNISGKEEE